MTLILASQDRKHELTPIQMSLETGAIGWTMLGRASKVMLSHMDCLLQAEDNK
jgi:hypothetical protein